MPVAGSCKRCVWFSNRECKAILAVGYHKGGSQGSLLALFLFFSLDSAFMAESDKDSATRLGLSTDSIVSLCVQSASTSLSV